MASPPDGPAFFYDAVAFSAHPDDAEMAMGGTLAALTAAGRRVAIVSLTRGELGTYGTPDDREREAAEAARILGCDVRLLDFPDGSIFDDVPNRHRLVEVVRDLRPRVVFAPYAYARTSHRDGRSNADHLATGLLVREACKLARFAKLFPMIPPHAVQRVYSYMLPDDVKPSWVVDVTAHVDTLEAAVRAYATQLAIDRWNEPILETLRTMRRAVGLRLGVPLGEGFLCEDAVGGSALALLEM
jgi:bacillithiol biosynthesis deacetylase BshB1